VTPSKKPTTSKQPVVTHSAASSSIVAKRPVSRYSASARRNRSHTTRAFAAPQPTPERYKEIQQALASKGYYTGEANGQWGAESVDALKRFQADQNIAVDGKIGSLSLIALGLGPKRLSSQPRPAPPPSTTDSGTAPSQPGARQ